MKWETPECGVYFSMPFDEYRKIKCLNASGIKEINISETDFWTRSFLNPESDMLDDDSKAKIEGRAYHKRILEGKDAFYSEYAVSYEDDGLDDVLRGNTEMKDALEKIGIKGLSGKSAEALSGLVYKYLPHKRTEYQIKKDYIDMAGDRELIAPSVIRHIEFTAKMIELHPDMKDYFKGAPEVTVVFDAFGARFKARFDSMNIGFISDLKTFANQTRSELKKAVRKAFANQKYHIQGTLYLIAAEAAKRLIKQGKVFDYNGGQEWLDRYVKTPVDQLKYAFVQKGVAPASIPLIFHKNDKGFSQGFEIIRQGVERFNRAYKEQGEGFWVSSIREEVLHFDELPAWANDV